MIGRRLRHYRIVELVRAGGMGAVYRAHDEHLDCDVAIKVLPEGTLADAEARRRFKKEALVLAKLDHPNILAVHDFDTQDGIDFLVLEFVAGSTVDEVLASGALPEKRVVHLGLQLAEGLVAANARGVVHRDPKPANLRITQSDLLKILDFGLAQWLQPSAEPAGSGPGGFL